VGVGCYVEVTVGKTPPREYALVAVSDDGTVTVHAGGVSHGQGHATALSQIAAARFRVPIEQVQVVQGDTGLVRRGGGTYASRTIQLAGSSVLEASDEVIARGRRILSYLLEAPVEDVELVPGQGLAVRGAPHTLATWGDLARLAATDVPEHLRGPLRAESNRAQPGSTYPFGTHVAVVELDSDTGWLRLVAHTGVDDCGQVVNPLLAGGQQHGGIAQGVGQALFEHVRFDDAGQPLGTSLMTYFIPAATDLPSFTIDRTATPTPLNPLGAKGIGEAGTLGSTPAIHSAAMDALAPFGVDHLDLPLASERVWRSMIGGMAS
jgi:carbon-monoxide dehydrogenase large subunit